MRNERGFLLIAGLWALALLSTLSTSLVSSTLQQLGIMRRQIEDLKSRADFFSAIFSAAQIVTEDSQPFSDSAADEWFGRLRLQEPFSERITASLEDEESKINLNDAPLGLIGVFFKNFENEKGPFQGSRKDYLRGIEKLRSSGRIESLEELLLAEGFKAQDFAALQPYLTVYPQTGQINLNTASPLVLKSLLDFLSADYAAKSMLAERLQAACSQDRQLQFPGSGAGGCFFRAQDLLPRVFMEHLKLPNTPQMVSLVQELLAAVTVDSSTFRIQIRLKNNRRALGIFRLPSGQERPEILFWNDF